MVALVRDTIFEDISMNDLAIIKKLKKMQQYIDDHRYAICERAIEGLIYDLEKGRRDPA